MTPPGPTATNRPSPNVTLFRVTLERRGVQLSPSLEVNVRDPTATNTPFANVTSFSESFPNPAAERSVHERPSSDVTSTGVPLVSFRPMATKRPTPYATAMRRLFAVTAIGTLASVHAFPSGDVATRGSCWPPCGNRCPTATNRPAPATTSLYLPEPPPGAWRPGLPSTQLTQSVEDIIAVFTPTARNCAPS